MKPLKQCDPKWGSKKLGTGTICDRGCTVTCCAMLAGTTPDKIVKEAQFTKHGAIYWQTLKSLKFHWRGYKYENDKVLKAIKDYGGCLVEVSMPSAPGGKHWVLAIGNGKIIDPLDGKEKPFSTYKPTGYAILETKQADMSNTIQIKKSTFEELVGKSTKYDEFVKMGYDQPKKIEEDIKTLKKELKDETQNHKKCELAKSEMGDKVREARERIESLEEELKTEKASKAQYKGQSERLKEDLEACEARPTKEEKPTEAKMFKLVLYLSISGGIGYVLSNYVANDPELFKIITPITNLVLYYVEQQIKVLKGDLGLKRSDK